MRRADRLFQIVQFLRGRRLTTARWLAEKLEVSDRTIYRDIQDLMSSGVPIDGEAGVGYVLHKTFDLPPLMFDRDELEAITIGLRMVKSWAGAGLERAANSAQSKVQCALPNELRQRFGRIALYSPSWTKPFSGDVFDVVRDAIGHNYVIAIDYQRLDGSASEMRNVWPLGLFFWGNKWTLAAWCETRQAFRNFRLDRISESQLLQRHFVTDAERSLDGYLKAIGAPANTDD
ncbi:MULTISPECIES: helix-turn-helix transcriptional regulator [Silvimonas]|uniref:helix-turn-helix transcriptional regulator n=1 Tax=Silvimonas TaxID=300264 RepID=UPI0024B35587|nr:MULTISPECIES: YafY family protein [Silvimonas]MDR3428166.1 YafY family protein [Silvimonas sp.]